ncbi:protein SOB FIVE-LIKE 1-like [Magnolia sinica]|uniref:protein SOB FIVE-LIKE 1-like n=1 Tax=Magnolia sinica TaxID=86752 RepID=UPI002659F10B|nr:protein SOB FIVE-LIKE 1-like [Magnolia sinica]
MEPSQLIGGTEECNSSESGWTMYIASPMHDVALSDDDHDGEGEGDGDGDNDCNSHDDGDGNNNDGDDDSDDSMASDASSGQSRREHSCKHGAVGNGIDCLERDDEHEEDDVIGRTCVGYPNKKDCKQGEEMKGGERRIQGEENKFHVCSTTKAKKTNLKETQK